MTLLSKHTMKKYLNKEIECIEFFIPDRPMKRMKSADQAFADYSERGIKPNFEEIENPYRFHQLMEGKRWRGIHVHEMWEDGILDGSVPYWTLLGGEDPNEILPRIVVNFLKREIFKGIDAELIEKVYQDILKYWTWRRRLFYKLKIPKGRINRLKE